MTPIGFAIRNPPHRRLVRRSEASYFFDLLPKSVCTSILSFANGGIDVLNQESLGNRSVPSLKFKQLAGYLASEFLFSESGIKDYTRFQKNPSYKPHVQEKRLFGNCRRFLCSSLTQERILGISAQLKLCSRQQWKRGPEVAVDELLSGWNSSK